MIAFIDAHRGQHWSSRSVTLPGRVLRSNAREGVLPIASSTYYANAATARDPSRASARARQDAELVPEIQRVWEETFQVYGVRKVWHQLRLEGFDVAVHRFS